MHSRTISTAAAASRPVGKPVVCASPAYLEKRGSGDTCLAAALEHQGIILQPSFLVGDDLKSGALVQLLPEYLSIALGVTSSIPRARTCRSRSDR